MSPGVIVVPGRSTTTAPAAPTVFAGPTASIRSFLTRTAHPSCTVSPSKTRAGLKTVSGAWAEPPDDKPSITKATSASGVFRIATSYVVSSSPRQACLRTFSELAVRARRRDVERRRGFRGDPMMRRLFVAVGEFDQSRLAVRKAEEGNADRQVVRREA